MFLRNIKNKKKAYFLDIKNKKNFDKIRSFRM